MAAKKTNRSGGSEVRAVAEAGRKLADLHVNYEQQPEHPLQRIENSDERLNWRVEKMRLSKNRLRGVVPRSETEKQGFNPGDASALRGTTPRKQDMPLSGETTSLTYNDFLTLAGIPMEAFEYRLGNRSALEWVVDQYQVKNDPRSGITNDPNRPDDPEYIVRLIGQVVTVSLETVKIVRELSSLAIDG